MSILIWRLGRNYYAGEAKDLAGLPVIIYGRSFLDVIRKFVEGN